MAPLAGPPDKALKEAKAIMKPMRRPMWPMSGVVCATQADPRGMRPPEKRPNKRVKAIIEPRVVMAAQQKVIPAVKTPITNKTLNLTRTIFVSEPYTSRLKAAVVPRPGSKVGKLTGRGGPRSSRSPHGRRKSPRIQ